MRSRPGPTPDGQSAPRGWPAVPDGGRARRHTRTILGTCRMHRTGGITIHFWDNLRLTGRTRYTGTRAHSIGSLHHTLSRSGARGGAAAAGGAAAPRCELTRRCCSILWSALIWSAHCQRLRQHHRGGPVKIETSAKRVLYECYSSIDPVATQNPKETHHKRITNAHREHVLASLDFSLELDIV